MRHIGKASIGVKALPKSQLLPLLKLISRQMKLVFKNVLGFHSAEMFKKKKVKFPRKKVKLLRKKGLNFKIKLS